MPSIQKHKFIAVLVLISIKWISYSTAFIPTTLSTYRRKNEARKMGFDVQTYVASTETSDAGAMESEVEALLRKARELRAEAEAAEEHLHSELILKKTLHDVELDDAIQQLFPPLSQRVSQENDAHIVNTIVENVRQHQFSTEKLKNIVTRLHEREVAARGLQHVECKTQSDTGHVKFEVVSEPDEAELEKVVGLVDWLTEAAEVIDEEFWKEKRTHGEKLKLHHSDMIHWTKGNLAKILKERAGFLGREHTDQFKNRLAEYYNAARRKKQKSDRKKSSSKK